MGLETYLDDDGGDDDDDGYLRRFDACLYT
jgi:hypothetical protein